MKVIIVPTDDEEVIDFISDLFKEVILLLDLKHEYII